MGIRFNKIVHILPFAVAALLTGTFLNQAHAAPISLGVAGDYSGFFFGDVNAASDVEGRLAVGGNLTAGFDIGYRNQYNSSLPSLVVAGDIQGFSHGTIYNGPSDDIDTNATIGPAAAQWLSGGVNYGMVKHGGSLDVHQWTMANFEHNPHFIDFKAVLDELTGLSSSMYGLNVNGTVVQQHGGLTLTGDGVSDMQVFDLGMHENLSNLSFNNIKAGAHIIINSRADTVTLGGFQGGDNANSTDIQAQHRDRLLFNFGFADRLDINTFVNGNILAYGADVYGSGHIEGTLIGHSLSARSNPWDPSSVSTLELGYEPFQPYLPDSPTSVPAPATGLLLLLSLPLLRVFRHR